MGAGWVRGMTLVFQTVATVSALLIQPPTTSQPPYPTSPFTQQQNYQKLQAQREVTFHATHTSNTHTLFSSQQETSNHRCRSAYSDRSCKSCPAKSASPNIDPHSASLLTQSPPLALSYPNESETIISNCLSALHRSNRPALWGRRETRPSRGN